MFWVADPCTWSKTILMTELMNWYSFFCLPRNYEKYTCLLQYQWSSYEWYNLTHIYTKQQKHNYNNYTHFAKTTLIFWHLTKNVLWEPDQYRCCCLRRQVIKWQGSEYVGPCSPQEKISTTCAISVWEHVRKPQLYIYIFSYPIQRAKLYQPMTTNLWEREDITFPIYELLKTSWFPCTRPWPTCRNFFTKK